MDINADAFFAKGKSHMICEDFAKAGVKKSGHPYAIVCDGCSSSPDTDTGARLLAHAAADELRSWADYETVGNSLDLPSLDFRAIALKASIAAKSLNLEQTCLDATLLLAYWDQADRSVRVTMHGDGIVAARLRKSSDLCLWTDEGRWMFWDIEAENNAPNYLNYTLDNARNERYIEKYGGSWSQSFYDSSHSRESDAVRLRTGKAADFGWQLKSIPEWKFASHDYDLVMIMSDGVKTFQERVNSETNKEFRSISIEKVIENIINIPSPTGKFLQRRCRKFLSDCDRLGWHHLDDFSVAAIWMGESGSDL